MIGWPILTVLILLPLAGVFSLLLAEGEGEANARQARKLALGFSLVTLGLALYLLSRFDPAASGFQFEEKQTWIPALGLSYHVGIDGISIWLVLLAALLVPIAVIASWDGVRKRVREFMIALLLIESLLIGTFCALDLVLFYLFYEGNLIPMFLLIGGWGEDRPARAAFKFVLFNMTGSVFLLVAILTLGLHAGTFEIPTLMTLVVPPELQTWLWLAMFVSFAIKMPLWPVHTWLPEVHVEAPTAASMLIAGLYMKLGTYGFLRLLLPLLPDASDLLAPLVLILGAITVVQNSLVAFSQVHLKKILAYATVAHMGMTAIGAFSRSFQSFQGCLMMLFVQGLVSAALFMCIGLLHERIRTYQVDQITGVIVSMPRFAFVVLMLIMGAVALPGTGNFLGEFLILVGAYHAWSTIAVVAGLAVVLGPVYFLGTYHKVMFAQNRQLTPVGVSDLGTHHLVVLGAVLAIMVSRERRSAMVLLGEVCQVNRVAVGETMRPTQPNLRAS